MNLSESSGVGCKGLGRSPFRFEAEGDVHVGQTEDMPSVEILLYS